MTATSTLKATNIKKIYKSRHVVNGVSLEVNSGQVVGLLGPNGAGKTSCFYMFVGIIPCDQGTISIDENDITHSPIHIRAGLGIGYLPQEASIFRKMTVAENIMSTLEIRKELSKQERQAELDSLLEEFHISHIRDQLGMSLSGGERRRVEIARALATNPKFILLDEPFAGVDPISVIDIKRIIKHLTQKGLGVFITDHHVREMLDVCNYSYIMNNGSIIAKGNADEIINDQQVRDVFLGNEFRM